MGVPKRRPNRGSLIVRLSDHFKRPAAARELLSLIGLHANATMQRENPAYRATPFFGSPPALGQSVTKTPSARHRTHRYLVRDRVATSSSIGPLAASLEV